MELDELRKLQKQVQGAAQEFKTSVESAAQNVHAGVRDVESELNAAAAEASPAHPQANALPDLVPRPTSPPRCMAPTRLTRRGRCAAPDIAAGLRQDLMADRAPKATRRKRSCRICRAALAPAVLDHCGPRGLRRAVSVVEGNLRAAGEADAERAASGAQMIATDVTGTFLVPLK